MCIAPKKLLFTCFILLDMNVHQFSISQCANLCQMGQKFTVCSDVNLTRQAGFCPPWAEVSGITGARQQRNTDSGKGCSLLHIHKNEDMHLGFNGKKKKDVKETNNEMEAKCWQNSNCIGFILI